MKSFLRLEVADQPSIINQLTSASARHGLDIADINYTIVDTDAGSAICTIAYWGDDTQTRNKIQEIPNGLKVRPTQGQYQRWFRLPCVRIFVVLRDKVGVVNDFITAIEAATNKSGPKHKGNIIDLKGFTVTDEGRFVIEAKVATISMAHQQKLVGDFLKWAKERKSIEVDVQAENFIYEILQEDLSDES